MNKNDNLKNLENHVHTHDHDHANCDHDHEHCNHDHGHEYDEVEVLRLVLDDDTELECYVLGIYEVRGKEYIALLPTNSEQVLLYEYAETDEGLELNNIEEDEIYDMVSKAFYQDQEDGGGCEIE